MTSPLATLTRRAGVLVAVGDPCDHCAPAPPTEDEYERFVEAELARGRRDDRELRDLEIMADVRRDKLAEVDD